MVNPNEAPEWHVAVQYTGSYDNCAFDNLEYCAALSVSCVSYLRDDGKSVYFILDKEPKEMSHTDTQPVQSVIPGISLRDYFAGCAITGFLARYHKQPGAVSLAYEVADAMLEEREKPLNGGDNAATN